MRVLCFSRAAVAGLTVGVAVSGLAEVSGQELRGPLEISAAAFDGMSSLRRFDALIETLAAGGELVLASSRRDAHLPGRTQQFLQQYHEGVPVYRRRRVAAAGRRRNRFDPGRHRDRDRARSAAAVPVGGGARAAGATDGRRCAVGRVCRSWSSCRFRAGATCWRTTQPCATCGPISWTPTADSSCTTRAPMREQSVGAGIGIQAPAQEAQRLAGRRRVSGLRPAAPRRDRHARPALRRRAFSRSTPRRRRLGVQRRGERRRQRVERPGGGGRACLHRFHVRLPVDPPGLARRGRQERSDIQHGQRRAGLRQCALRLSAARTGKARRPGLRRDRGRYRARIGRRRGPRADAWRDASLRPAAHGHAPARYLPDPFRDRPASRSTATCTSAAGPTLGPTRSEKTGRGGSFIFGAKKAAMCWLRTRAAPSMKPGRTCSAPPLSSWCTSRRRVRCARTT